MYDGGKIVVGLIVFALVATVPIWYGAALGKTEGEPVLEKVDAAQGNRCVLEVERMRAEHMKLLQDWRLTVVRGTGKDRFFAGPKPNGFPGPAEKSLVNTCLGCHTHKERFCDRCHDYAGVTVDCWDCHIVPKD